MDSAKKWRKANPGNLKYSFMILRATRLKAPPRTIYHKLKMIDHLSPDDSKCENFAPPPEPPQLLSDAQIVTLATQGHLMLPLPPDLTAAYIHLFNIASDFFSQPDAIKSGLYPNIGGPELGYTRVVDEKEYLTLDHASHSNTNLERLVSQVWRDTAALLHRVMADLARGLA